jgi:hypothetical protein
MPPIQDFPLEEPTLATIHTLQDISNLAHFRPLQHLPRKYINGWGRYASPFISSFFIMLLGEVVTQIEVDSVFGMLTWNSNGLHPGIGFGSVWYLQVALLTYIFAVLHYPSSSTVESYIGARVQELVAGFLPIMLNVCRGGGYRSTLSNVLRW